MRLRILLDNPREAAVPLNPQEYLTAAIYSLLAHSDVDYAAFLHDVGYCVDGGPKTFKLFTFSGLRVPAHRRRVDGAAERLWLAPGCVEWLISSPVEAFLTHCATGLLAEGVLRVGGATFSITQIETLPIPLFTPEPTRWTCLAPIVCALPLPGGGTRYLRLGDGEAFSEATRRNLLAKHQVLHGGPPQDETLRLTFDPAYLARSAGTKKITYKGIDIIGAFAPFTLSGSPQLQELGWQVGFGEKNAAGFGMAEFIR